MVVAIVICHHTGILFFRCLANFQSDHYSRMPTGSILDLTVIFRLLSIATYIGRPWLIQWPPCPYHRDMDSLMQISSNGEKFCARCSLKFLTKSSTSLQQYCSDVISDGRLGGCSLNLMHIHRSSNHFRGIPKHKHHQHQVTVKEMMSVHCQVTGPHGAISDQSQVQGQCKQME